MFMAGTVYTGKDGTDWKCSRHQDGCIRLDVISHSNKKLPRCRISIGKQAFIYQWQMDNFFFSPSDRL